MDLHRGGELTLVLVVSVVPVVSVVSVVPVVLVVSAMPVVEMRRFDCSLGCIGGDGGADAAT